jgi:serine/threonine protein phosphatase 1
MKRLIIGDIQGCYTEFQELIDKAALSADDEIIALGDMVDRGPASPQVLAFFMSQPNAHSLMGNHERKHVRAYRGEVMPALSQIITRHQIGEERYPAAVAYMATLPPFLDLPEAILVHAFFEPGVALHMQRQTVIVGGMQGEAYLTQRLDRPWYELYDGDKPIIVGHRDYAGKGKPFIYRDRVFGIDTGCCFGGALTGVILPDFHLISVPARKDYWTDVKHQYRDLRKPSTLDEALPWGQIEVLLAKAQQQSELPPAVRERMARLQTNVALANRLLDDLLRYIVQEHDQVLAQLRAECAFDTLTPQEQGSLYAARIGTTPLAMFLHLTRKGELSRERLRKRFKSPQDVMDFGRQVGLPRP